MRNLIFIVTTLLLVGCNQIHYTGGDDWAAMEGRVLEWKYTGVDLIYPLYFWHREGLVWLYVDIQEDPSFPDGSPPTNSISSDSPYGFWGDNGQYQVKGDVLSIRSNSTGIFEGNDEYHLKIKDSLIDGELKIVAELYPDDNLKRPAVVVIGHDPVFK